MSNERKGETDGGVRDGDETTLSSFFYHLQGYIVPILIVGCQELLQPRVWVSTGGFMGFFTSFIKTC